MENSDIMREAQALAHGGASPEEVADFIAAKTAKTERYLVTWRNIRGIVRETIVTADSPQLAVAIVRVGRPSVVAVISCEAVSGD